MKTTICMGTSIKTVKDITAGKRAKNSSQALVTKNSLAPATFDIEFVELLARSNFSFLQGASHPEEMVEQAIRYEYSGIALSDVHGLYGVVKGFQAAQSPSLFSASLKPKENFRFRFGTEFILGSDRSVVLLPINKTGYSQICKILTLSKRNSPKGFCNPQIDFIRDNSSDLICFALPPWDNHFLNTLKEIFQDRLYLPIWRDLTWESREYNLKAFHLEQEGYQIFATQRAFMHQSERKKLLDVQTCIHHQTTLEDAKTHLLSNGERCLKPIGELIEIWQDRLDLLEKTVEISDRLQFTLNEIQYQYPSAKTPASLSSKEYLRNLVYSGAEVRFGKDLPPKVVAQIENELNLISDLKYEDYFLTLHEICEYARSKNILFQGRGSAANSVVCYCLGLTAVNPVQIDLLFERFISRERGEPPDIDIDFEHERREEVIQYIYERYTAEHAAMVCTVIRYKGRMALREVAKVFGIPLQTINAMIKYMGRDGLRRLQEEGIEEKFQVPLTKWKMILQLAAQMYGFPRHLGIHSGGFLITHNPLTEIVPVEKATMNGRYVVQWNKDDIDTLKMMKVDILSLGMLSCLRKCFDLLKTHKDIHIEMYSVPADDPATYEMIGKADTVGVFQIESRAQMNTLPRMKPKNFYDLAIEVALVRPGPLQGGTVHPFLKRRQGLEKIQYPHPDLKPILEKTMGVPIFQEQVMKIAIVAAGFTPGEADELRRVMSSAWKQKKITMDGIRERIISGLVRHGISAEYAEQIYKVLEGFSNYGFPESHAASFAIITYVSCWMKCHHPEVFTCALLNSQPMGFYAPRSLISDVQRHGVEVLPLDVQCSQYDYHLENGKIRTGFRAIIGLPEKLIQKLLEERKRNGIFKNLEDFVKRVLWPKSALIKLAASGAMLDLQSNTRHLIWEIESLYLDQQSFLYGQILDKEDQQSYEAIPFESQWSGLQREYESHGFSVHHHPLSILRSYLKSKNEHYLKNRWVPYLHSQDLKSVRNRNKVRIAGLLAITQRPPTAKGMCFLSLEDEYGFINVVVHPEVYNQYRLIIYQNSILEIQGVLEKQGPLINIRAEKILAIQ